MASLIISRQKQVQVRYAGKVNENEIGMGVADAHAVVPFALGFLSALRSTRQMDTMHGHCPQW